MDPSLRLLVKPVFQQRKNNKSFIKSVPDKTLIHLHINHMDTYFHRNIEKKQTYLTLGKLNNFGSEPLLVHQQCYGEPLFKSKQKQSYDSICRYFKNYTV